MNNTPTKSKERRKGTGVDVVPVPLSLLHKMSEVADAFEAFQDELEDYLLSQDPAFLARMNRARTHHLEGQTHPLDELKHKLCIE
ncbi:MAG TPA: hypothetical protein ENO24_01040 [Chloroflexi bacterium]|nr:hypothetical protein [Chloroflexota bacterium]